jgi:hypothetical protein
VPDLFSQTIENLGSFGQLFDFPPFLIQRKKRDKMHQRVSAFEFRVEVFQKKKGGSLLGLGRVRE